MAYTGPERRVHDDPLVPQWEERRGRAPSVEPAFDEEPDDVLHARQVEDDYAEAVRQATYVADGQ